MTFVDQSPCSASPAAVPVDRRRFLTVSTVALAGFAAAGGGRVREVVMGVGGAGATLVRTAWSTGLDAEFWIWDHDRARDPRLPGARRIRLPAAGRAELGRPGARPWIDEGLTALPTPLRRVAVMGGLGGATASHVLPALVRALAKRGVGVGVFCSLPFGFEGFGRRRAAEQAIAALGAIGASPVVVRYDNQLRGAQGKSLAWVLRQGDARLVGAVRGFLGG